MKNSPEHFSADFATSPNDHEAVPSTAEGAATFEVTGEGRSRYGGDSAVVTPEKSEFSATDTSRILEVRQDLARSGTAETQKDFNLPAESVASKSSVETIGTKPSGKFRKWVQVALAGLGLLAGDKLQGGERPSGGQLPGQGQRPAMSAEASAPSVQNRPVSVGNFPSSNERQPAGGGILPTSNDRQFSSGGTFPQPNYSQFTSEGNYPQPNRGPSMPRGNYPQPNFPRGQSHRYSGQLPDVVEYYVPPGGQVPTEKRKLFGQTYQAITRESVLGQSGSDTRHHNGPTPHPNKPK